MALLPLRHEAKGQHMTQRNILRLWSLIAILLSVCSAAFADQTVHCTQSWLYELPGVRGSALNQLRVNLDLLPFSEVGHTLANDQIHMMRMAEELGLTIESKHVLAFLDGNYVYSGGIYLFIGGKVDAQSYLDNVVSSGYALYDPTTGQYVQFADRPEFEGTADLHAMKVLGAVPPLRPTLRYQSDRVAPGTGQPCPGAAPAPPVARQPPAYRLRARTG
jgi:hypothetical protein